MFPDPDKFFGPSDEEIADAREDGRRDARKADIVDHLLHEAGHIDVFPNQRSKRQKEYDREYEKGWHDDKYTKPESHEREEIPYEGTGGSHPDVRLGLVEEIIGSGNIIGCFVAIIAIVFCTVMCVTPGKKLDEFGEWLIPSQQQPKAKPPQQPSLKQQPVVVTNTNKQKPVKKTGGPTPDKRKPSRADPNEVYVDPDTRRP